MTVIDLHNITKKYNLYKRNSDRIKEALNPLRKKYHSEHFALRNISFSVQEGEVLGIIGKNGSGKSTLLKIISEVLTASSGNLQINGRVSALLELGSGFDPEYTGIENLYFNGAVLGLTKSDIDSKLDDIIEFADIGEYIYQPVKTYSSGMLVRLAFSVAVCITPEILIVDEALSVGDIRFQQKSIRKMKELMDKSKAIIFVSHDIGSIMNFCTRVIWLKDGEIFKSGDPISICKEYITFMNDNGQNLIENHADLDNWNEAIVSEDMLLHIEDISLGSEYLKVSGWGLHKDFDSYKQKLFIKVKNSDLSFIYLTEQITRPDVTKEFKDLQKNFDFSGFSVIIPKKTFNNDTFSLEFLLEIEDNLFRYNHGVEYAFSELIQGKNERIIWESIKNCQSFGKGDAIISGVSVYDTKTDTKTNLLNGGEFIEVYIKVSVISDIVSPIIGFVINDSYGNSILGINTFICSYLLQDFKKGNEYIIKFMFKFPLFKEGTYTLSPAISNGTQDDHYNCHWIHDAIVLTVKSKNLSQKIGALLSIQDISIQTI